MILTEITEHEVRAHIDSDARDAFKRLQNYKRMSRAVKRVLPDPKLEPQDEEAIRKDLQKEFDDFIRDSQLKLLSVDDVSAGPIFKNYFAKKPPFGDKNKKSEFPDAFAVAALEGWCKGKSEKMYVVSGDPDWKRACKENPDLIYVERLDELLEKFGDSVQVSAVKEALTNVREDVVEFIQHEAYNLDLFVSDKLVDAELDDVHIDVQAGAFHVVEANNGKAIVSIPCTLNIAAEVTAMDPNSMWTDPDTGELKSVWRLHGSVTHETERDVTMEVAYDANNTDTVGFKNVHLDGRSVEIDVEEESLSCSDESEFADFDALDDADCGQ